jgi:hypothetical protein
MCGILRSRAAGCNVLVFNGIRIHRTSHRRCGRENRSPSNRSCFPARKAKCNCKFSYCAITFLICRIWLHFKVVSNRSNNMRYKIIASFVPFVSLMLDQICRYASPEPPLWASAMWRAQGRKIPETKRVGTGQASLGTHFGIKL